MSDTIKVPRFKGVTSEKTVKKDVKHVLTFTAEFLRAKLRLPWEAQIEAIEDGAIFEGLKVTIETKDA